MGGATDPRTEFVPVTDPKEFERLMAEAFRFNSSAMIWTRDQQVVLNSHLLGVVPKSTDFRAALPPNFDAAAFQASLAQEESGPRSAPDCFFSVSLPSANLFFKARYMETDPKGLRFEAPKALFKVQRRNDVRLTFPAGTALPAAFDHPSLPKQRIHVKLIDLSAAGLSFGVKPQEEPLYSKGLMLTNLTFRIGTREFKLQAEVKHIRATGSAAPEARVIRIGVKFSEIRAGDSQAIAAYVFQETRKFFSSL